MGHSDLVRGIMYWLPNMPLMTNEAKCATNDKIDHCFKDDIAYCIYCLMATLNVLLEMFQISLRAAGPRQNCLASAPTTQNHQLISNYYHHLLELVRIH